MNRIFINRVINRQCSATVPGQVFKTSKRSLLVYQPVPNRWDRRQRVFSWYQLSMLSFVKGFKIFKIGKLKRRECKTH